MKVQRKNVSKSRGGDSANSPKIESHDAGSLTDADLDNLFIDNSDGNIKSHSMIESVKQNLTARPKKSLVSSDVDNNLGILKKLNFFLKSKQDSAKML